MLNPEVERLIEQETITILDRELKKLLLEEPLIPVDPKRTATRSAIKLDLPNNMAPTSNDFAAELLSILDTANSFL